MLERSCVYKFIGRSQQSFARGATLPEVLGGVDHYRRLVRRAYGPIRNPLHRIATSKAGLSALAFYEYSRSKGAPLPNANTVIQTVWPIKRRLRLTLCGGEDVLDVRPDLIEY